MNNIPARLPRVSARLGFSVRDRVTLDGKQEGSVSAVHDIGDRTVTPRGSAFVYELEIGGRLVPFVNEDRVSSVP